MNVSAERSAYIFWVEDLHFQSETVGVRFLQILITVYQDTVHYFPEDTYNHKLTN
jgi:hypothetical protein